MPADAVPGPVPPAADQGALPDDRPATVDPELYLRLVGERTLLARDDGGHWGQGDLGAAASALVAVGLLPVELAVAVVEDYQLAAGLRGDRHARMMSAQPTTAPVTQAPTAPVVALCRPASPPPAPPGRESAAKPTGDAAWVWDVHHVVLGDTESVLSVSSTTSPPWERNQQRFVPGRPHPRPTHPGPLPLADDTGHVEPAEFSGGGGGEQWSGNYTTPSPLSRATRWLEFDGRRLDLVRPTSPPTVRVEDHGSGTPAERHLRHRLAADDHRHDDNSRPDAAVDALLATGSLDPASTVLAEIDAVRAAQLGGGRQGVALPRRYWTMSSSSSSSPVPSPSRHSGPATDPLPAPWASALRVGTATGPVGVVPLGVATPVVEGAAAVLRALTTTADHFTVDTVQFGGGTSQRHGNHVEVTPSFAWWARDDLGQWYRGDWSGWSGDENSMTGDVLYTPPLDRRARSLYLLPTMPSQRAMVEITLPDWAAAT